MISQKRSQQRKSVFKERCVFLKARLSLYFHRGGSWLSGFCDLFSLFFSLFWTWSEKKKKKTEYKILKGNYIFNYAKL